MMKKLKYIPYGQCHVVYTNTGFELWSYTTKVIDYTTTTTTNTITCTGLYSMTTRKHISAFMKEYFPQYSYYSVKWAVEKNNGELVIE